MVLVRKVQLLVAFQYVTRSCSPVKACNPVKRSVANKTPLRLPIAVHAVVLAARADNNVPTGAAIHH